MLICFNQKTKIKDNQDNKINIIKFTKLKKPLEKNNKQDKIPMIIINNQEQIIRSINNPFIILNKDSQLETKELNSIKI